MRPYLQPRLLVIFFLGFSSGLPLALTASTLTLWLAESGVDKAGIGLFASIATPYALKFLWSPLIDGVRFPLLGRVLGQRRGWLVGVQACLIASIIGLGCSDPAVNPWVTALAGVCVAFFSATQDIVVDAYRVELLAPEQQSAGAAMANFGYRVAMITSSAGALYLVAYFGWQGTYFMMSGLILAGTAAALFCAEPTHPVNNGKERLPFGVWLKKFVIEPFADFMTRPQWVTILLFVMLYKFADAFIGGMTNPFLHEIGFQREAIASIVKIYGFFATITGSFFGVWLVRRFGVVRILWAGGLLHALTNLMFVVQAQVGADARILALGISLENFSGGVGSTAFVAFLSALCNARFTATQYALLSSLSAVGRTLLSTPAGWVAKQVGWEWFFLLSAFFALPGLLLLRRLHGAEKP